MSFKIINNRRKIVKIARDVIKQINAHEIKADTGNIFRNMSFFTDNKLYGNSAQTLFENHFKNKNPIPCEVCAKGALTIAWIRKFNNCTIGELRNINENNINMLPELVNVFGEELLDCIETAFEKKVFSWAIGYGSSNGICDNFVDFYKVSHPHLSEYNKRDANSNILLTSIMQNIIDNNGRLFYNNTYAGK